MIKALNTEMIVKSPFNVRNIEINDPAFDANIKQLGVLQPPVVRVINGIPQAVLGWSRVQAAKKARQNKINCDVREMTDEEALLASFSENEFQHNLSPTNRAIAVAQLIGETKLLQINGFTPGLIEDPYTQERLGYLMGVSNQSVSRWLEPLRVQPETRELLEKREIPEDVVEEIRKYAKTPHDEVELAQAISEVDKGKLSGEKRTLTRDVAARFIKNARDNETPPEELIKKLKAMRDPEVTPPDDLEEDEEEKQYLWPLVLEFRPPDDVLAMDSELDHFGSCYVAEDVVAILEKWDIDLFEKLNGILREWLKVNGYR